MSPPNPMRYFILRRCPALLSGLQQVSLGYGDEGEPSRWIFHGQGHRLGKNVGPAASFIFSIFPLLPEYSPVKPDAAATLLSPSKSNPIFLTYTSPESGFERICISFLFCPARFSSVDMVFPSSTTYVTPTETKMLSAVSRQSSPTRPSVSA